MKMVMSMKNLFLGRADLGRADLNFLESLMCKNTRS